MLTADVLCCCRCSLPSSRLISASVSSATCSKGCINSVRWVFLFPRWGCQFSMLCKYWFVPGSHFGAKQIIHLLRNPGVKPESRACPGRYPAACMDVNRCMLLGLGKKSNRNAVSSLRLGLVFPGKDKMLFCSELCSRNKCNLKASIQLISLPFLLAPQGEVWEGKMLTRLFCQTLGYVLGGLCWCCLATCFGTNMFCAWKQLVNLGAKLIELKFNQFLISGLNQYQLILKYGRVHSTCIMLVSFCFGRIQQTE